MLTTLQMNNCFQVRTAGGTGTAFIFGNADGWAFFTGGHVIAGVAAGDTVYFKRENDWMPASVTYIMRDDEGHDVAAFSVSTTPGEKIVFNHDEPAMEPGAEVKFLGFPHGLDSNYPSRKGFATPLVRSAHLSGIIKINGVPVVVFDGFNNPGYSGGPVYWISPDGEPLLVSVISGYRREIGESRYVYRVDSDGNEHIQKDMIVRQNSGMIYGCTRDRIFLLLSKFPHLLDYAA